MLRFPDVTPHPKCAPFPGGLGRRPASPRSPDAGEVAAGPAGHSACRRRIRPPRGLVPPAAPSANAAAESLFGTDDDLLQQITAGLDRLEQRADRTHILQAAARRGYFTPDEEDQVHQALLAYRQYRLAAYEIIFRHRDYDQLRDEGRQLRSFLLAFGAALLLYAKSLHFIQVVEHQPTIRAKLNEPDPRFDLEGGFFDEVLLGYSSLSNYRALLQGDRFWRRHRAAIFQHGLSADPAWAWLHRLICRKRWLVRRRLADVLLRRLYQDWRTFWRTVLQPAKNTRYGLQTLVGGRFAALQLRPRTEFHVSRDQLSELRPLLRAGDILLSRTEGKLTAALLPGFWSHAAIFLGSAGELADLGVNTAEPPTAAALDAVAPDPLGCVIEAVSPRVRIAPLAESLRADHVLVLRPHLPPAQVAAALREALRHLGQPYDFEFDFSCATRVVCTGLVYRSFHRRGGCVFPLVKRLGRFTLTGDDIVNFAVDALNRSTASGQVAPLQPIALRLLRRDGRLHAAAADRLVPLLARIRTGWRPARRSRRSFANTTLQS